jgi:hypothetical protein
MRPANVRSRGENGLNADMPPRPSLTRSGHAAPFFVAMHATDLLRDLLWSVISGLGVCPMRRRGDHHEAGLVLLSTGVESSRDGVAAIGLLVLVSCRILNGSLNSMVRLK